MAQPRIGYLMAAILRELRAEPDLSARDLTARTGAWRQDVAAACLRLVRLGLVTRERMPRPPGRRGHGPYLYRLAAAARRAA